MRAEITLKHKIRIQEAERKALKIKWNKQTSQNKRQTKQNHKAKASMK